MGFAIRVTGINRYAQLQSWDSLSEKFCLTLADLDLRTSGVRHNQQVAAAKIGLNLSHMFQVDQRRAMRPKESLGRERFLKLIHRHLNMEYLG